MTKRNLLDETVEILQHYGKSPDDVQWVGSGDSAEMHWREFAEVADVEYDPGSNLGPRVVADLVVVGDGWWLERDTTDFGAELWRFKIPPTRPGRTYRGKTVVLPDHLPGRHPLCQLEPLDDDEVK